jgi:hypothetical protein
VYNTEGSKEEEEEEEEEKFLPMTSVNSMNNLVDNNGIPRNLYVSPTPASAMKSSSSFALGLPASTASLRPPNTFYQAPVAPRVNENTKLLFFYTLITVYGFVLISRIDKFLDRVYSELQPELWKEGVWAFIAFILFGVLVVYFGFDSQVHNTSRRAHYQVLQPTPEMLHIVTNANKSID